VVARSTDGMPEAAAGAVDPDARCPFKLLPLGATASSIVATSSDPPARTTDDRAIRLVERLIVGRDGIVYRDAREFVKRPGPGCGQEALLAAVDPEEIAACDRPDAATVIQP
jgi:hypothetical protein